jgi:hypothetical protein
MFRIYPLSKAKLLNTNLTIYNIRRKTIGAAPLSKNNNKE